MAGRNIQLASQSRIFTLTGGAGPGTSAVYQGLGRGGAPDWAGGDITPVRIPSARQYGQFEEVATIVGLKGLPSLPVELRSRRQISDMLTLFQMGCPIDLQVHVGACTDPTDFLAFEKIYVLENARPTNWSESDLGALDGDQEAPILETVPFTGSTLYQVVPIRDSELGTSEIVQEIVGVIVPDQVSCGDCGRPSDGSQIIFAVTLSAGGSPGLAAEVIYSDDQGNTLGETNITTLGADEDPTGLAAVGSDLVVISNDDLALHYAPIADILNENESWSRVATGFVAAKGPNAIHSLGRTATWMVGDGGYVYFTSDITVGVEVQSAGSATIENLIDVHGVDEDNLVAVGENNAVLNTNNGGETWVAITGPNVGVDLNRVAMQSPIAWLVGDAAGNLWFTVDGGVNWTAKSFSGSGSGSVNALSFATKAVGYMAHTTGASVGRIFRTIDGGSTWFRLPGGGLTITPHNKINRFGVASGAPDNIRANLVFAGGLGNDAIDGVLLKIA